MIRAVDHSDTAAVRTISVSAVVLTRPDGAVITVRKVGTDRFMLPGGKWETGESPLECAVREIDEELGVALTPGALEPLGRFDTATANEPGFLLVSEVFAAGVDGDPEPRAEIAEARWVTMDELREIAALPEDDCAPWAPLLVRVARERLGDPWAS
ncbi:MAG: NUDIX domain-containing protein [Streptomyces sp.]|nr:NUDIX domain-containing protein [Streptomyces sp.]